jgi:hypothetical protein
MITKGKPHNKNKFRLTSSILKLGLAILGLAPTASLPAAKIGIGEGLTWSTTPSITNPANSNVIIRVFWQETGSTTTGKPIYKTEDWTYHGFNDLYPGDEGYTTSTSGYEDTIPPKRIIIRYLTVGTQSRPLNTLSPGTSQNAEINLGQAFQPIYHDNPNASGEPAIEWWFKVENQTNWQTQAWTPTQTGTYAFQVKKTSRDGTWNDSDPSGNYTLTVKPKIDEIPLNIQTPLDVTIALGDTYVPELPDETNDYKDVSTYELKAPNQNFEINVPIDQLKWTPPLPGTYTLTLRHMGEIIDNTNYLKSELVTITLHVLEDHWPVMEQIKRTTTEADPTKIIPEGWHTYTGDTIAFEFATLDPDHDHDPKWGHHLNMIHWALENVHQPDKSTGGSESPAQPDANGRATTRITVQLNNTPSTYALRAYAQDHKGKHTTLGVDYYTITVTEPYAFYQVTASAKPAAGLEAWFVPSGTTRQTVKLPRPRGPIQTQPNP